MIAVQPVVEYASRCPHCGGALVAEGVRWQGIHVCVEGRCELCGAEIVGDLPVGQAIYTPYQVDLANGRLFGPESARNWFGRPLQESLQDPRALVTVGLTVERVREFDEVVILNCIDHLYGHSLLKLLNAQTYLNAETEVGLVVIIPTALRWMVPEGIAEVWVVDMPFTAAQGYYPDLDRRIRKECGRFRRVWVSEAHSHPKDVDITRFTKVATHNFAAESFRVTFVWREDRPWASRMMARLLPRRAALREQNRRVCGFFSSLRALVPGARFTVAGLGTSTSFPEWIDDRRCARFTDDMERETCELYRDSRLVVGIHGSNMLLPSAHAGLVLDLMPWDRWGNFAQDLVFQEDDNRVAAYRYRCLPEGTSTRLLAQIAALQIRDYPGYRDRMLERLPRGGQKTIRHPDP